MALEELVLQGVLEEQAAQGESCREKRLKRPEEPSSA